MVYPGHSSRGCQTCKQRRIRCDALRPTCRRCSTSGRACLGYQNTKQPQITPSSIPTTPRASVQAPTALSFYNTNNPSLLPPADHTSPPTIQKATSLVVSVICEGLSTLRSPVQTISSRQTQFKNYGLALEALRAALSTEQTSSSLVAPVFLFSLFEMIVSSDLGDRTWQLHFDAVLSMLSDSRGRCQSERLLLAPLCEALRMNSGSAQHPLSQTQTPEHQVRVLLSVTALRLRALAPDIESLFARRTNKKHKTHAQKQQPQSTPPRKLDIRKSRVAIARLRRDLRLVSALFDQFPTCAFTKSGADGGVTVSAKVIMLRGMYHCLNALTGSVILTADEFLRPAEMSDVNGASPGKQTARLVDGVRQSFHSLFEIGSGIANSFTQLPQLECESTDAAHISALQDLTRKATALIWPLSATLIIPHVSGAERERAKGILGILGELGVLPFTNAIVGAAGGDGTEDIGLGVGDVVMGLLFVCVALGGG